jgi:hypothetical protein
LKAGEIGLLNGEMAVRFALALEVSADELLGPAEGKRRAAKSRAGKFCDGWNRLKNFLPRNRRPCSRRLNAFIKASSK